MQPGSLIQISWNPLLFGDQKGGALLAVPTLGVAFLLSIVGDLSIWGMFYFLLV